MKTQIKVNTRGAYDTLDQSTFDKVMKEKGTINLTSKRTTGNKTIWGAFLSSATLIFMILLTISNYQTNAVKTDLDSEFTTKLEEVLELNDNDMLVEEDLDELIDILDASVKSEMETVDSSIFPTEPIYAVKHKEWDMSDKRQDWINYAYRMGGKDFLLTILAENGTMGIDRKSNIVGANGYSDYGLCQINVGYHPEVLGTKRRFKEWFYNPYKQLDYCWELYSGGTRFYGYDVRYKVEHKLEFYK